MVLGMLFENFVHILRYVIYEFLKKVLGGPRPTCLVRVHCVMCHIICGKSTETPLKHMEFYSNKPQAKAFS